MKNIDGNLFHLKNDEAFDYLDKTLFEIVEATAREIDKYENDTVVLEDGETFKKTTVLQFATLANVFYLLHEVLLSRNVEHTLVFLHSNLDFFKRTFKEFSFVLPRLEPLGEE